MTRLECTAILASAGSGKTYRLTGRYLALLLAGAAPERILAVTFTRAAAGQILERLLDRLAGACRSDAGATALHSELIESDSIPVPALTAGDCRAALRRLISCLDRTAIGTIDSFFARVAGAMALELDLPAGWSVAEEAEFHRQRVRAVERVFERLDHEGTLRLVRLLHRGLFSPRVFSEVLRTVEESHAAFLESGEAAWREIGPAAAPLETGAVQDAIESLARVALPKTNDRDREDGRWSTARSADERRARDGEWEALLDSALARAAEAGAPYFGREMPAQVRRAYAPLIAHAGAVLLGRLRDQNLATLEIVRRFDAVLAELRGRTGVCTFDDVPRALLRAEGAGDLQHVYFALDGRIDHALIDEFQDTSRTQFRLLEPLLDEIVCDAQGARSLLCVGDVKQSLYQWRGAAPELLPSLTGRWRSVRERPLDTTRRCRPPIVEAVNGVFTGLEGNPAVTRSDEATLAAKDWSLRFHKHDTSERGPGAASLIVTRAGDNAERAHAEHAADHIADLAFSGLGSIGVLFPMRRLMALLLTLLRDRGVDAAVESGTGLADSPAVAAVLSLLRLADYPGNSAAAFHVATSPLGAAIGLAHPVGRGRADEAATGVRRELAERGYAPTIGRWARIVRESCDARDRDRLAALVELAERYDPGAGLRPSEFADLAASAKLEEAPRVQVRLLTVHGSKGLEFDAVVLPDLDDPLKPRPPSVLVERRAPLAPVTAATRYASDGVRCASHRLREMCLHHNARAIGERFSVLYVAMTRAIARLDMLLTPSAAKEWPATLAGLLHGALAPDRGREPGCVLWSAGTPSVTVRTPGRARAPAAAAVSPAPIRFGPPTGRASRAAVVAPSLAGGFRPLTIARALDPAPSAAARDRGTLVHAWLENVEWLETTPVTLDRLREWTAVVGSAWDDSARSAADSLLNALARGDVNDLLCRARGATRAPAGATLHVRREQPFAVRAAAPGEPGPRLIVGRLDRLVVASTAGRPVTAEIVDYKTETSDDADDVVRDAYAPQLRAYRAAVASMLRLPAEHVRVSIALVFRGRVVAID